MDLRLELLETDPGSFTVIVGEKFADHLCRDEALAVVAGALFCNTKAPPFLKTYREWSWWDQRYRQPGSQPFQPAVGAPVEPTVRPQLEPVTLADVLDALNLFNRPKPSEDDGPWESGHYIRVDHLPNFINIIAAAWFAPAMGELQREAQERGEYK